MSEFFKELINDPRLTPGLDRTRNGPYQEFRQPGESSHAEPLVKLEPPLAALYAELIDDKWYWVNGCSMCEDAHPNDKGKTWAYQYCDTHNVCVTCGKHRSEFKESVWGNSTGAFRCNGCQDKVDRVAKIEAVQKCIDEGYTRWDHRYEGNIKCPYCATVTHDHALNSDDESDVIECHCCGETFEATAHIEIKYTTTPKRPVEEVRKEILGDDYVSDDESDDEESESSSESVTDALPATDEMTDVINQAVREGNEGI